MKLVILAGGYGTRLSEETQIKPKPMVEIGGKPILWHIMKIYSCFGITEFIICLGYKGYIIKEYFANYFLHQADVTFDLNNNQMEIHNKHAEPWKVTLLDTGLNTMTGGRLLRAKDFIGDETFMMTYGDGLADIDINELINFHKKNDQIATLTAVQPSGRFGAIKTDKNNNIVHFQEKPDGDGAYINGGFFILKPEVFGYLKNDTTIFERSPLEEMAKDRQLNAYNHHGFWMAMDKLSDKNKLEEMWNLGNATWKIWN
jgi:glucose-1-phosphate cytidylyltransferase